MELRILIIFFFAGIIACQPGTNKDTSKIGQLKETLATNPSKENRTNLLTALQDAIKANPNDARANALLYKEMADLHISNNESVLALQTLMQGIQNYPQSPTTAENVWSLATIYQQYIQRPNVAIIIKKLYAQQYPKGAHAEEAMEVLRVNSEPISADITALGSSMYDETTHKVDFQAANDYIRTCELYALLRPQDGESPNYLHKAGETARAVRAFPKAVEIYDWIYTEYPTYEKAAQALFLKAFTYDNDLGDKITAKNLYEEFLKKYPNDDFADDTQFLLANLGKDDEEIIKGFSGN